MRPVSTNASELYGDLHDAALSEQWSMSAAREEARNELLLQALGGPVDLNAVDWHVKHHSLREISHDYVKHYDSPKKWMYSAWLSLTGKGELLARSIEQKGVDGYRPKSP